MFAPQHAIPRPLKHELPRAGLLAHLHAETDVALLALVAPSGYGKTTLLAQHARRAARPLAWLTLREADAEPLALGEALAAALQQALPGLALAHWTQARTQGASPEGAARALAHDLAGASANVDVVLDGADVLGADSGQWLDAWLDALPEGHRLLLSARAEPPLGLARRAAQGQAQLLGAAELAFSPNETRAYLSARGHPEPAAELHARLEGWPVGVALVASGAAPHLTPADLLRDVLRTLPPTVRAALPEAAVLPVWSEGAAQALGLALPPGWLREVRRVGVPLTPLGAGSWRPLALVQAALDAELAAQPERAQPVHARAAQDAQASGDGLRALRHWRAAGNHAQAARLAEELVAVYEARWEFRLVREVLDGGPAGGGGPAEASRTLRRALGQALFETGEAARGEALLRALYAEHDTPEPALLFSLGVLAARAGQPGQQLAWAEAGLRAGPSEYDHTRLLRLKASAQLALGQLQAGLDTALEATRRAEQGRALGELGAALTVAQAAYRYLGQPVACEHALRRALDVYAALDMPGRSLVLHNDLADLLRTQGRLGEALGLLRAALPVAARERSVMAAFLHETLGEVLFEQGDWAGSAAQVQAALEGCAAFGLGALPPRLWPKLAEVRLRAGDPGGAAEALAWGELCLGAGGPEAESAWAQSAALLALEEGDLPRAEAQLARVLALAASDEAVRRAGLYGLAVRQRQGTLLPGDLHTLPALLRGLPGVDAALGAELAQQPATPLPAAAPAGPILSVRTCGALAVSVDGEAVPMPLSKSGELLVYLALHGPSTRDQLVDALWDGSAERRHVEYFKVAARQLRAALSRPAGVTFNPLPFEGGRYGLAPEFALAVDVSTLRRALDGGDPEALQAAFAPLQGPFLPEVDTEWAELRRAEYSGDALTAALTLGEWLRAREPRAALPLYRQATVLDPLATAAWQGLARTLLGLGERTAAQQTYAQYCRTLAQELAAEPELPFDAFVQAGV
ncbi:BTAD domain-containing putative transcriptional regulator [Deinococcus multiflagellatus]|uniref:BTAD domain-containing putative transcriptional regulator n=1 Tax=Deinococcus multiflagellatus TaxID=1656887 RepID=UPI001CCCA51B|nr:BTAD domain-containing putative transcriptional regulator [Deinococcus multiflagellatus]MBZ9713835.1 hypothetical protein [Deinococcus multiflagellatus]